MPDTSRENFCIRSFGDPTPRREVDVSYTVGSTYWLVRWLDNDGDGKLTGPDQYILWKPNESVPAPRQMDYFFFQEHGVAFESYVTSTLEAMQALDRYVETLPPLQQAFNRSPGEHGNLKDKSYSYIAGPSEALLLYDSALPYLAKPYPDKQKRVRMGHGWRDREKGLFTVELDAFSPDAFFLTGRRGMDTCCCAFDKDYSLAVAKDSPDALLVANIRRYFDVQSARLDPAASQGKDTPPRYPK